MLRSLELIVEDEKEAYVSYFISCMRCLRDKQRQVQGCR